MTALLMTWKKYCNFIDDHNWVVKRFGA